MKDYICPKCNAPLSDHTRSNNFWNQMCLWRFKDPLNGSSVLCDIPEIDFYKEIVNQLEEGTAVVNTNPPKVKPDPRSEQVNIGHWAFPSLSLLKQRQG